jgi:protein TonB
MDIQQIQRADLLDILFDGRNKDYGAYDLRKSYNRRLRRAMAAKLALCTLLFIGFTVTGKSGHTRSSISVIDYPITPVEPIAIKKDPPLPIPKPLHFAPPAPTIRMVTTRIVPDDQVRPDDKPQPSVVPDNFRIDVTTNTSATGADVVRPLTDGNGPGSNLVEKPAKSEDADDNTIFRKVEIESHYKGGDAAWQRFLLKNFRVPLADEDQSGDATVVVQFIVDKEGNVSNVEPLSGPAQLQKEAVRVIRLSGKWEPAIQNGRPVRSYKKQPITVHWEN